MTLPFDARQRAVVELTAAAAPRVASRGTVYVTDEQWNLFTTRMRSMVERFLVAAEDADRADAGSFQAVESASRDVASGLEEIRSQISAARVFEHPRHHALDAFEGTVLQLAQSCCDALAGGTPGLESSAPARTAKVFEALEAVAAHDDVINQDPWHVHFGLHREDVEDVDDRFAAGLLVERFHKRGAELEARIRSIYKGFGFGRLPPAKSIALLPHLLDVPDPIETATAVRRVAQLITAATAADPDHTHRVLTRLTDGVERSYTNSITATDVRNRLRIESRPDRSAMLQLELYRKLSEGQVKPWGWVLVCLLSHLDGKPPMLAELRDRLRSTRDQLALDFAACLHLHARNAAAHEDFRWDPRQQALVGSQFSVSSDELSRLTARGYGLMAGAELGWAFASIRLEAARTTPPGQEHPTAVGVRDALLRFGTNGVRVVDWYLDGTSISIDVAELPHHLVNPCAQALIEIGAVVEAEVFVVHLSGNDEPAMTASAWMLDAIRPLWRHTVSRLGCTPPAVVLPILFQSRLLVETPQTAATALRWLAVNEGAHFIDDYIDRKHSGTPQRANVRWLADDLDLTSQALQICADHAPDLLELLGDEYGLLRRGVALARHIADDPSSLNRARRDELTRICRSIYYLCDVGEPCAPLPTVDSRPLE